MLALVLCFFWLLLLLLRCCVLRLCVRTQDGKRRAFLVGNLHHGMSILLVFIVL